MNRKKNGIRNIKFGILNKLVTILCPFIMRTILIKILGAEYLGLASLFTSILQVLNLTELGVGSAMVFELYEPIAQKNIEQIRKLQKIYKVIYRIIGSVIFLMGICILPFLKFFINGGYPNSVNIHIIYLLYLINTVVSYLMSSYKTTLLIANQRNDIISRIGTYIHIVLYIIQVIFLRIFKNYYLYVIWIPIFTIIENFFKYIYVIKMYPDYFPSKEISKEELKKIFVKVKDLFGHKLSNVVTNSVDTIVISAFLGLSMVTIYNNYYYILSAVVGVLEIVYQGILAGIGNSIITESAEKNKRDFKNFHFINSWLVGWCAICFLCLYQPLMNIWMGKENMLPFSSIILLSIYFYIWKIRQTVLLYKDAAGMWKIDRLKPYIEIVFNLIVNIILVKIWGINGVILSTILSMILISLPYETFKFFRKFFNENTIGYFRSCIEYLIITVIIALITYDICSLVNINIIYDFLIKIIICIIVPNVLAICIYYRKDECKYCINLVKKIIKRKV